MISAGLAQLVEQLICNHQVPSSNLGAGTIHTEEDDKMEIIWHLLLTVCSGSTCIEQGVQWFDNRTSCETMLVQYAEIPSDGDWDSVEYQCKPVDSLST